MLTAMNYRGLMVTAALTCLIGCTGSDEADNPLAGSESRESLRDTQPWPFEPAAMRVHPLSRLVMVGDGTQSPDATQTLIEARVEFLDREGHTTKGFGTVAIELYDAARPGSSPLLRWTRDLRDLEQNARHFDDVTRTYLFKLETVNGLPERPYLVVRYESAAGARLQADRELRR